MAHKFNQSKKLKQFKQYLFVKNALLIAAFAVFCSVVAAQTAPPKNFPPPAPAAPAPESRIRERKPVQARNETDIPAEKFIAVAASVNLSLCINSGNLKINGWDKNQLRVMIDEGSQIGFKILKRDAGQVPVWLKAVGYDSQAASGAVVFDECLSGEDIEINVPRGATVDIKSGLGEGFNGQISSVFKASAKILNGNLKFEGISENIDAQTLTGDIEVRNSAGSIKISTMNGDILVSNVQPLNISDSFSAKSISGSVNLQSVAHPQVEAASTSGSVSFAGALSSGGQYSFSTHSGSIILAMPANVSTAINAIFGIGNFKTLLPLVNVVKTPGQFQRLTGRIGLGDAALNIKTFSGAIAINKLDN